MLVSKKAPVKKYRPSLAYNHKNHEQMKIIMGLFRCFLSSKSLVIVIKKPHLLPIHRRRFYF